MGRVGNLDILLLLMSRFFDSSGSAVGEYANRDIGRAGANVSWVALLVFKQSR